MFYFVTIEYWNGEKKTLDFMDKYNARTIYNAFLSIAVNNVEDIRLVTLSVTDCDNETLIEGVHF